MIKSTILDYFEEPLYGVVVCYAGKVLHCLLLKLKKYGDYKRKYIRVATLLTNELPQYVGMSPMDWEVKNRFVYRNINLKAKTSIQTVFF